MTKKSIVWFRQDLRIKDNPALFEAAKNGEILAIYILDEKITKEKNLGEATKLWLHHSLKSLNESLNNKLNFYVGDEIEIIEKLIYENDIEAIFWNRCYEPLRIEKDKKIKSFLKEKNITAKSFNGSLLWEPWEILKSDQTPYKVFTHYYRKGCLNHEKPRRPFEALKKIDAIKEKKYAVELTELNLLPKIKWDQKIKDLWEIGEKAAQEKLENFVKQSLSDYKEGRNFPSKKNVSRLSPHLHFGEISPHQIWYFAQENYQDKGLEKNLDCFLSELGWREFSYYLLYHFPTLNEKNFQPRFDNFLWQKNVKFLHAWQAGMTGIPIVDAGMRELWQTGYMHNRTRMIVGSFLVKNLLIDWREGEKWFWNCLLDADLANNSASWQWVAGSGADAAPYFRIFNPLLQAERFDADGEYTRRFVPEIAKLPNEFLFQPWKAPLLVLREAGIELGKDYPFPIVDLEKSRNLALEAFKALPKAGSEDKLQ